MVDSRMICALIILLTVLILLNCRINIERQRDNCVSSKVVSTGGSVVPEPVLRCTPHPSDPCSCVKPGISMPETCDSTSGDCGRCERAGHDKCAVPGFHQWGNCPMESCCSSHSPSAVGMPAPAYARQVSSGPSSAKTPDPPGDYCTPHPSDPCSCVKPGIEMPAECDHSGTCRKCVFDYGKCAIPGNNGWGPCPTECCSSHAPVSAGGSSAAPTSVVGAPSHASHGHAPTPVVGAPSHASHPHAPAPAAATTTTPAPMPAQSPLAPIAGTAPSSASSGGGYINDTAVPQDGLIRASTFDQFFVIDTGVDNCTRGITKDFKSTGCPTTNIAAYIPEPGKIIWKDGQSITFRTKEPILKSGQGFVGFVLDKVPVGETYWNSIWLMGPNQHQMCMGDSCFEIDIYEMMESGQQWWSAPKISFHDWGRQRVNCSDIHENFECERRGCTFEKHTEPKCGPDKAVLGEGCFGLYLDSHVEGQSCSGKNIITKPSKEWPRGWEFVPKGQSKMPSGASWFAMVTGPAKNGSNAGNVSATVGISLSGWLPKDKGDLKHYREHADFLVETPIHSVKGNTVGGFYLCLTSTAKPDKSPADGSFWKIPAMSVIDMALD